MSNMNELVGFAIGLMIVMIIAYMGAGMGEKVQTALPVNASGDFASATTGAEIWTNGFSIVSIVVIVIAIAMAIRSLKGIQGGNGGQ